jgi:hypothetical protein
LFLTKVGIFKFMPKKIPKKRIKDLQFYKIPKMRRQFALKLLRIFLFLESFVKLKKTYLSPMAYYSSIST